MSGCESRAERTSRGRRIVHGLRRLYPDATCSLHHDSALELLVATILSAQCTDERVNQVTPALFRRYRSADDYAAANLAELEDAVRSTGFFRNKAKALISMGRALVEKHGGKVPETMEEFVRIPGVGRKTANVILGTWFRRPAITVDTHVARLSERMELSKERDPEKIERDLMEIFPESDWTFASHALIWHGRRVCAARRPQCDRCGLRADCPYPTRARPPSAR